MQTVVAPWHTATLKTRPACGGLIETAISMNRNENTSKRPTYPCTRTEAKQWFRDHGVCINEWAEANGLSRYAVFDLLRGKRKGFRGETHRAAVLLGLKPDPEKLEEKAA